MSILADVKQLRRQAPDGFATYMIDADDGMPLRVGLSVGDESASKGTVLFIPGRTEFIEKFFEDMHVWQRLGYAVAGMDLRGQGLSHRALANRDKHFVHGFDQHVADIKSVFDHLDEVDAPKPWLIMAHSAGGHCSLRFLAEHPTLVQQAILSAPMVDILPDRGLFRDIAGAVIPALAAMGLATAFLPGHGRYKPGRYYSWRNQLTHDPERFEDEDYFVSQNAELRVGGVTFGWLTEATKSIAKLNSPGYVEQIDAYVLMFPASEDSIVSTPAIHLIANRLKKGRTRALEGAKHETLKETDAVRAKLWRWIAEFIGLDAALL